MKPVRRRDREIAQHDAEAILDRGEYGVLSTIGADGQPYGVPLSYVYRNGSIYFHCAVTGQKLDNIEGNARVSFCVVGATRVLPDKFATEYESAVVFGVASETEGTERRNALLWLLEKYCTDFIEEGIQYIEKQDRVTRVFKIRINHISGKARSKGAYMKPACFLCLLLVSSTIDRSTPETRELPCAHCTV